MKRDFRITDKLSQYGIYFVLLVMILFLSLTTKTFFSSENIINVLRQVSINGILAMGVTLIIITAGIDLSIGSILALAGVFAASVAHPEPQVPLIVSVLLGLLVGLLCGVVNGLFIAYLKLPAFIATLGMTTIARGVTLVYTDGRPVIGLTSAFKFIGQGSVLGIPVPIYVLFWVAVFIGILLHKTRYGRYLYAIGGNIEAAQASGINTKKVIFSVYAIGGFCCGIGGILLSARTGAGAPAAGVGYELDAIASAILGGTSTAGGRGTVFGTIAGVLIMGIISNGLDILNVSSYIQQIVKGVIIIGAVLLDQVNKHN